MGKDIGIQVIDNTDQGDVLDLKVQVKRDADIKITTGLVVGHTLEQNKAFLLIGQPNDFKEQPTLGIGFNDNLLDDELLEYRHKIRDQFSRDGLKIKKLELYNINKVQIEAYYE
ncbi:hypothetical protein [Formosa sp. A9]|uniref:hypothetical protein n=1 Tax=Formosa sp. A9 TaxID=3442641 RepID=UPI003EBB4B16